MCNTTMDKPNDFSLEDFSNFLLDHMPLEHVDYIMGLVNLAEEQCKCNKAWAKLLESNNESDD